MRNVVVVDGFRTPLCKEGTDFRETDADVLGAWVVREMITRCHRWNLPLDTIDCVLGSNVATPTHAVNPTRVAAVTGGLPAAIPADTVAGKKLRIRSDGALLCKFAHQERRCRHGACDRHGVDESNSDCIQPDCR